MFHPRNGCRFAFLACAALLVIVPRGMTTAFAQLRGHGGPVRALAISSDGQTAVSGSFDSTAICWSLTRNAAEQVLRFHADAVNAVALLGDGRAVTAGADRSACGFARRRNPGFGVMGSNRAAMAAGGRRAACARRAYAERQRHCV